MIKLEGTGSAQALNKLAREKAKETLLKDILIDLMVCKIEGFDYKQYITEIKKLVDDLYFKITKPTRFN